MSSQIRKKSFSGKTWVKFMELYYCLVSVCLDVDYAALNKRVIYETFPLPPCMCISCAPSQSI